MPKYSNIYKALNQSVGKALHAYGMIQDGDRIAVGLSGGKDSWALLWLLAERQTRVPVAYTLFPIHIDLGFDSGPSRDMQDRAQQMGWPVRIEYTDFGVVAHSDVNRENPCFLCARKRRQRLFEVVEFIGRWSMIDVFVVAILAALVQLDFAATISPGIAAVSFSLSVAFTMLAAQNFDPRLIWDAEEGIAR